MRPVWVSEAGMSLQKNCNEQNEIKVGLMHPLLPLFYGLTISTIDFIQQIIFLFHSDVAKSINKKEEK